MPLEEHSCDKCKIPLAWLSQSVQEKRNGCCWVSATTFLIPGVALVLGIFVRHESVALLSVFGSGVCVAGAWLMRRARSSEEVHNRSNLVNQGKLLKNTELRECEQGG
jgi:hypothetical protein